MCDPISATMAVVSAGSTIAGSRSQSRAARSAANAARDTSADQIRLYRDIFNTQRQDLAPFRQDELNRRNAIGELFGFDPVGQAAPANTNTPGGSAPDANAIMRFINNGGASGYGNIGFRSFNPSLASVPQFAGGPGGYAAPGGVPTDSIANMSPTGAPPSHQSVLAGKLPVQDQPEPATMSAANDGGLGPTVDPSVAGADRFNNSIFNSVFTNNFNRDRDRIDASLGDEVFSGARTNAVENSRANNFQNALGSYISTLMNTPPTPATNAGVNAAGAYGAQAGSSMGQMGNALMQSAYQRGNANANMWGGLGQAGGFALGSV